jgi:hypothetical protein
LDLVFTNDSVDVSVAFADSPLLKLDRHHRAYEIETRIRCCEFGAMESATQRYMFRMTVWQLYMNLTRMTGLVFSRKQGWIVASACSTRWYRAALKAMYP